MGEAVLGAFLSVLLDKLAHREVLTFGRLKGVNQRKLEKWTATLIEIEEVLDDAQDKQLTKRGVKLWLDDLRDLAYDLEDILDTFATELLLRQLKQQHWATTRKLWRSFSKVQFNFNMNLEIEELNDRLQEISQRKEQFGLNKTGTSSAKEWKIPPSSCQPAGPVIGRVEDKRKIVEYLSKEEPSSTINFHVVAIVGMPGVGKTTLAGDVFNHNAMEQFHLKAWVSVSDDFDLLRLTKAILEYVTSQRCNLEEFSKIQEELMKELRGKKFLIVLDDVWVKHDYDLHDLWTRLQSPFSVGATGSKILVTTRDQTVAKIMGASEVYSLECVSDDHCLEIFEQHAYGNQINSGRPPNFELLQTKVVAKCSGLPLASRTLGGILCYKKLDEWEEILNSELWSLFAKTNSHILPVLKMSYHYLPSKLKRCFAYCSILPHDYEFEEKQLILLWMAEGLIQPQPEDNKQMEDSGHDYFQELLSRSLFQKSSIKNSKYVMHDLVSDMARWAAGEICFRLDDRLKDNNMLRCSPKARHSSYIYGRYDGVDRFEAISKVKLLRTFLPLSLSDGSCWTENYLTRKVTFDLLPKLLYLRVLSLKGYQINELPNSIGKLKHLRYLDLSYTLIVSLPKSASTFFNLQTLIVEGCYQLKALPTSMRNLINLRHLNNSYVPLEKMPPQLGLLTNLQTLSNFAIGKGSGSRVREIGSLLNLQGTLQFSRLENVTGAEDACSANLKSKEKLETLLLEWSDSSNVSTEIASAVLDKLHPHWKLKELTISGYAGLKFSAWIGDPSFSNMVLVRLEGCIHCQFLPPFGQLSSLKELHIQRMPAVESVGPEFYGEGNLPFQALEALTFESMDNWQYWSSCQQDQGIRLFCSLKMLSIKKCPKLEGRLPENVDLLEKLEIFECEELVVSISNYKLLHESDIRNCKGVVHASPVHFELLESLCFSNILELRLQTEEFMKSCTKVKELKITGCEKLTSSFGNEDRLLQDLISLSRLHIEDSSALVEKLGKESEELQQLQIVACKLEYMELKNCGNLVKVPKGLHYMTYLQELYIFECSSLVSLPDIGLPPSLKVVCIDRCNSLLYFAKYQIPPSLRRIHISNCENLRLLLEEEEEVVVGSSSSSSSHRLEELIILMCPSMVSLLVKGQLPRALKHLDIKVCTQLESITDSLLSNNCRLEIIDIWACPNLKSLPDGLCHPTNLQSFRINRCEKLEVVVPNMLRDMMHNYNLNSVQVLRIDSCEGLTSFPPNLRSLSIEKMKSCKGLLESRGLHRLTYLTKLFIDGEDDSDLVSFPPADKEKEIEMLLPKSLIQLVIWKFPNLKKLSKDFQLLTCLEFLQISACPKLASIPEEGLPLSVTHLVISNCPLLEERCKGRYWSKIAHIPCIRLNNRVI